MDRGRTRLKKPICSDIKVSSYTNVPFDAISSGRLAISKVSLDITFDKILRKASFLITFFDNRVDRGHTGRNTTGNRLCV